MRFLSIVFSLFLVVPAASGEEVHLDAQRQARAGIQVAPVVEEAFGDSTRVVGQVVRSPGSTLTLRSLLGGRIESLHVAPGDLVRGGNAIVELHSHDFLKVQGDFLRAEDKAALADRRLEAGVELFKVDGISKIELESRTQEAFSAKMERDSAQSELFDFGYSEAQIQQLSSTRSPDPHLPVLAPKDAVVLELMVQEDQWVQPFEPLVKLGDPQRVELELQIPPDKAADISADDPVQFTPVGRVDRIGRATVVSHVPQVDPETRTVRVRARIEGGADLVLFPGVFVEGKIAHGDSRRASSVPQTAVIRMGQGDVVFVRTGRETFEIRPVELGLLTDGRYEVLAGVENGESVVIKGVFLLKSVAVASEDS